MNYEYEIKKLLISLGGELITLEKVMNLPNILCKFNNNIWFSFNYNDQENSFELRLGRLFFNNLKLSIFVLEKMDWIFEKLSLIGLEDIIDINSLSLEQIILLLEKNLQNILNNYDILKSAIKSKCDDEENRLYDNIIEDISTYTEHELGNRIFNEIDYLGTMKRSRISKMNWTICAITYDLFIFILAMIVATECGKNPKLSNGGVVAIIIAITLLLMLIPTLTIILGWKTIFSKLYKKGRKLKEIAEKQHKNILEINQIESDLLRKNYNLPDDVYTRYEYYTNFVKKEMPTKKRWILFIIFEFLFLTSIIGFVFSMIFSSTELSIAILSVGFVFGIYGLCILVGEYVKGIKFSIVPVLCYVIPLVVMLYILNINKEWIIGLGTIVSGSILLWLFLFVVFVIPRKKIRIETIEYYKIISEEKEIFDFVQVPNFIKTNSFYLSNGSYITIFYTDDTKIFMQIYSDILFNGVTIKNALIESFEYLGPKKNIEKSTINSLLKYRNKTINYESIFKVSEDL